MKNIFILTSLLLFYTSCVQKKDKTFITDASCGQCMFDLNTQKGCDLAIKFNNKAYFVDGVHIDDYGDAHDQNTGFCNTIRKVEISGELIDDRYKITFFKLVK